MLFFLPLHINETRRERSGVAVTALWDWERATGLPVANSLGIRSRLTAVVKGHLFYIMLL